MSKQQTLVGRWGLRAEDRRKLWLMTPVFLLCGIAEAMNYNGFMTLFNQRLGGSYLPYVYAAEAVILPFEAWGLGLLADRLSKPALMRVQYAVILAIVAANAAWLLTMRGMGFDSRYYYALLFLTSNFVVRQQTIMLWSLAVDVCPTQQAKRLMPIFVSGATLGGMLGGIATQAFSRYGADIVYAIGPALLIAASFNYRKVVARYLVPLALRGGGDEAAQGAAEEGAPAKGYFRGTFRSPFLAGVLGMMTIMPALYFLIEYLFLNVSRSHFPDESDFGRMMGIVSTVMFALAFLLQLVSGKLMSKIGASGMIVAISAVYAIFFVVSFAAFDSPLEMMALAASYMLMNVLVYYSAEPSYQLFYKTLPLRERDGYRFAAQGMASFLGVAAGVLLQLLHNGLGWSFGALALAGAAVAAGMLGLAWAVRQLYVRELVRSVRSFDPAEKDLEQSLRELTGNAKSMASIVAMLGDESEQAREIALDILGAAGETRYTPDVLARLGDESQRVRIAALRALNLSGADLDAMIKVAVALEDPEPDIRTEAVRKLAQMKHMPEKAFFFLRLKLMDAHPGVVAEAVKAMYLLENEVSYAACFEVIERILGEGGEPTVPICRVVAELGLARFAPQVDALLHDRHPSVRVAATACLGALRQAEAMPTMLERLPTADQELHRVTIRAFVDMGPAAVAPLRGVLPTAQPKAWHAAAAALAALLPEDEVRGWLAEQSVQQLAEIEATAVYAPAFAAVGRPDVAELAALRCAEASRTVVAGSWAVLERLTEERSAAAVRRVVGDPNEEIRGGGLEVLAEGFGERRLSQRLAAFLQREPAAVGGMDEAAAREAIGRAAASTDDWWREMAAEAGRERGRVANAEENRALGRLGKVVYLKKVPFFADLSLEELGLIAGASAEAVFEDGAVLLRRGEKNESMYIIVEGNVELTSVTAAGLEATLGVLGPGDVCGATSALDESRSTVTAQSFFGETRVLALRREEVTRLVRLYPEIGIGLLRASLARVRLLEEMMMRIDS